MNAMYSYPYNANEALALMYAQNQLKSNTTPEMLANYYKEALLRINQALSPKSEDESD